MDAFLGILFFTSGFTTASAVAGLLLAIQQLRTRGHLQKQVDEATSDWTANLMRKVRWPTNEAARNAMEP